MWINLSVLSNSQARSLSIGDNKRNWMQLATIWEVEDLKRDTWHLLSPSNFHISSYKGGGNLRLAVDFCGHSCLVHISPQLMGLTLLGVSNWSALILLWPRDTAPIHELLIGDYIIILKVLPIWMQPAEELLLLGRVAKESSNIFKTNLYFIA